MLVSIQIMILNVFRMIFMKLKFSPLKHIFLRKLLIFTQNHEKSKIWISGDFSYREKNSKIEFVLKIFEKLEIYALNSPGVLLYAIETHFWRFYEMLKIHRNPVFFIDFGNLHSFIFFQQSLVTHNISFTKMLFYCFEKKPKI